MRSRKHVKKTNFSFLEISKKKKLIGLFLTFFLVFTFYFLLQLFRKLIIVFDALSNDYELFLASPEANQFYNFLFAFIAVFFAFSIVFVYLLDTPRKFLLRYNYKKKSIINQQRLTNWYFLSWFSRIGFLIGLLALDYSGYNLYSENKYILILFIAVFLGQIWMSIRWFFKDNKLKWFFITLIITLALSFGLSQINILDNQLIDKSILSKNVLYNNDIHVVRSDVSTPIKHRSLILDIVISNQDSAQKLIVKREEIILEDFEKSIFKYWRRISKAERPFVNYVLFVDQGADMQFIHEIKQRIINIGGIRLYYATGSVNENIPFYCKTHKGLNQYLKEYIPYNKTNQSQEVGIKILENGDYFFNKKTINKFDLEKEIKNYFKKKGIKSLRIYQGKNTSFYQYFQILESSKIVINELRNEFSINGYATDYVNLNREQKKFISVKYRWQIIDDFQ